MFFLQICIQRKISYTVLVLHACEPKGGLKEMNQMVSIAEECILKKIDFLNDEGKSDHKVREVNELFSFLLGLFSSQKFLG